jgi:23S rRNA (guanosine2251-2'-O)-methyltransferase
LPNTQRVIALDQVTDPQNMGAILRTCAVFGVQAVIVPRHNTPRETGALAKAASGALEIVPILRVTNLSRALDGLKKSGFFVIGLAGEAERTIGDFAPLERCVLVAGAEGQGLRRLVREHCDATVALPVAPTAQTAGIDSLNVGAAVAVALHDLVRCQGDRYQRSLDD